MPIFCVIYIIPLFACLFGHWQQLQTQDAAPKESTEQFGSVKGDFVQGEKRIQIWVPNWIGKISGVDLQNEKENFTCYMVTKSSVRAQNIFGK